MRCSFVTLCFAHEKPTLLLRVKALPVWFNAKTQRDVRLAPSETDQPRVLDVVVVLVVVEIPARSKANNKRALRACVAFV